MKRGSWIGFVSGRWFSSRRESGGSVSSMLAASGIAIGVAALIVVLAVMNGFQMGFIDSILEIASFHLRVEDERHGAPDEAFLSRLSAEEGVKSVLPYAETHCILATKDGRAQPISLRLLPNDVDRRDPALAPALGISAPILPAEPGIVLGAELARYLDILPGASVDLIAVTAGGEEGVETKTLHLRIARTFRSGYYEFDSGLAMASLDLVAPIFGNEALVPYVYGIKLADRYKDGEFAERLESAYGLDSGRVQRWRDYNRAFFGALKTEKTVMMLLIGLIFIVVGMNIFHSMRRAVAERMEDIAVLRSMGASPESLRRAFIIDGLAIGAGGAFVGLVLGLLIAVNVNQVFALAEDIVNGCLFLVSRLLGAGSGGEQFSVFSPQYFYLMEVPVRVLFPETLFVVAIATASAAAAAHAAAVRVSRMHPAEVLRYE